MLTYRTTRSVYHITIPCHWFQDSIQAKYHCFPSFLPIWHYNDSIDQKLLNTQERQCLKANCIQNFDATVLPLVPNILSARIQPRDRSIARSTGRNSSLFFLLLFPFCSFYQYASEIITYWLSHWEPHPSSWFPHCDHLVNFHTLPLLNFVIFTGKWSPRQVEYSSPFLTDSIER